MASAAGIWRAADSISASACSAALWIFDVGALTTSTPRAVAAATSTLSRPTPARATIFSLGAAASTSASTVVAERTSSASASGNAASSFSRSGPSTQRISTWSPSAGNGGLGQFVGNQYNRQTHADGLAGLRPSPTGVLVGAALGASARTG